MGKVEENKFNVDFKGPFSCLQASTAHRAARTSHARTRRTQPMSEKGE